MGLTLGLHNRIGKTRKGALLNQFIRSWWNTLKADGGEVDKISDINSYWNMAKSQGIADNILFGMLGGYKLRTDGGAKYVTKAYSLESEQNEATQTTETNQPYLTGYIVPNEKWGLKNPNGENRYLEYPEISFASDEAWSVTTVFNSHFNATDSHEIICGNTDGNRNWIAISRGALTLRDINGDVTYGTPNSITGIYGKTTILTVSHSNDGIVSVYIGGKKVDNITFKKAIAFATIGYSSSLSTRTFKGLFNAFFVRNNALTYDQVVKEASILQQMFPEIETVKIGNQEWTSNFEAIATPMGTIFENITENTSIETITGGDYENGLVGNFIKGDEVSSYTLNSSNPISGTQDGLISVTSIGTKGYRPSIKFTVSKGKWCKLSFDYRVNSGICTVHGIYAGNITVPGYQISGSGTFEKFYYSETSYPEVLFNGTNLFNLQIDNLSNKELGWSDSQDLYNYLIADGYSEYDALKECAWWCYYNNDPSLGATYGKLYNWFAVKLLQMDIDLYNAANPDKPWGCHVPNKSEFDIMVTYLGGADIAGKKLKALFGNFDNEYADNRSGFSLLASGYRYINGLYTSMNAVGRAWLLDECFFSCQYSDTLLKYFSIGELSRGFPLRLLKD